MNHPSFRPTRGPFWPVVHGGQCGPKIVGIGSFCDHRSNPGAYSTSWTIQQSSPKAVHHKNPQRSRAPSQEKIRTHSHPWISFKRRSRPPRLQSYCRQAVLIVPSQARCPPRVHGPYELPESAGMNRRVCEAQPSIWQPARPRPEGTPHQFFESLASSG